MKSLLITLALVGVFCFGLIVGALAIGSAVDSVLHENGLHVTPDGVYKYESEKISKLPIDWNE